MKDVKRKSKIEEEKKINFSQSLVHVDTKE